MSDLERLETLKISRENAKAEYKSMIEEMFNKSSEEFVVDLKRHLEKEKVTIENFIQEQKSKMEELAKRVMNTMDEHTQEMEIHRKYIIKLDKQVKEMILQMEELKKQENKGILKKIFK